MNQLAEQLKAADQVCSTAYPLLEEASSLRANAEAKVTKCRKRKTVYRVVSIIAILSCVQFISTPLVSMFGEIGGFIAIPLMIIAGVLLYTKVASPMITTYVNKSEAEYTAALNSAAEAEAKGTEIFENHAAEIAVIPEEYWYPMATNYIYKVISTGRADSLKQALQMYDEQLHRWKIEEANAEMLDQQKQQTRALKGIRKSNAINAVANVTNAAVNIGRWF